MLLFAPIRWALKLLYFAVLASVVYVIVSGVQVVSASHLPTVPAPSGSADAIVVLGAPTLGSTPGPDLLDRLEQALVLYDAKVAPALVVTGGPSSATGASPAVVAKSWLIGHGVASSAVASVEASDDAAALLGVKQQMHGGSRAVIVTDAIDALWTRNAAGKDGINATISPAVNSERAVYEELGPLWRQATGVAVGRIIGYANTPWAAH